uniref:Ionotropic glutamate receptor C-terminal domain-containing protein n=1 Tax=Anopheles coluzzii TaxID=1518534 RepID=A0A6E8WA31_ANOCL
KVLTFEKYFLEQVATERNATAIQTDEFSGNVNIMPFVSTQSMTATFMIPAFGTVFEAVQVPRAKPRPIVSILTDPFDLYVWITYLVLVITMAISISLFGKLLGRRRFMEIVLELIMMCLAGPSRAYGGSFENRIITLFCLMGIVLVSSYQSLIISFMSFVRYGAEINTLQEIQDHCMFPDNQFSKFYNFSTFPNESHPGLGLGCKILTGRDNELQSFLMMANLINDRHAYAREDYIHHHIQNFRLAKTTFFQYPFCIGVKPHLRELFEFYIQAVVESGIYEYYYNNKTKTDWKYEQRKFIDEVVKLDDLLLLWFAYMAGMFISTISFMAEIVVHREYKLFHSTENKSN